VSVRQSRQKILSCRKGCASAAETEGLCYEQAMSCSICGGCKGEVYSRRLTKAMRLFALGLHNKQRVRRQGCVVCVVLVWCSCSCSCSVCVRPVFAALCCVAASPTLNQSRQFSAKPNEVTVPIHFSSPPSCSLYFA